MEIEKLLPIKLSNLLSVREHTRFFWNIIQFENQLFEWFIMKVKAEINTKNHYKLSCKTQGSIMGFRAV